MNAQIKKILPHGSSKKVDKSFSRASRLCDLCGKIFLLLFLSSAGLNLTDGEWREKLGRERYNVMRRKGTEPAFSGLYLDEERPGTYVCAGCAQPLFSSEDKYSEPGCGWPLFKTAIVSKNVYYEEDRSMGFKRYEVLCSGCDGHLGHVFHDGPPPKNFRYTINSLSLVLIVKKP
jgi:peptide-methionine (R)-S-oxide reductase